MDKDTCTISAPFLKEFDPEFQRFLELVNQLESDLVRLGVSMAALKVGYYALTKCLKETVSKE